MQDQSTKASIYQQYQNQQNPPIQSTFIMQKSVSKNKYKKTQRKRLLNIQKQRMPEQLTKDFISFLRQNDDVAKKFEQYINKEKQKKKQSPKKRYGRSMNCSLNQQKKQKLKKNDNSKMKKEKNQGQQRIKLSSQIPKKIFNIQRTQKPIQNLMITKQSQRYGRSMNGSLNQQKKQKLKKNDNSKMEITKKQLIKPKQQGKDQPQQDILEQFQYKKHLYAQEKLSRQQHQSQSLTYSLNPSSGVKSNQYAPSKVHNQQFNWEPYYINAGQFGLF